MTVPKSSAIFRRTDDLLIDFMRSHGITLARISIGVVFVWFGLLKALGVSPVANLVELALPFMPTSISVPLIGIFEVALGLMFILGLTMRVTLGLFWLHMAGTFLVPLIRPDLAFQSGNPLYLTTIGEFVVKNVVLISAGVFVGGSLRKSNEKSHSS